MADLAVITPLIDGKRYRYADGFTCSRSYLVNGELDFSWQLPVRGKPYTLGGDWPSDSYRVLEYELEYIFNADGMPDPASQTKMALLHVLGTTRLDLAGTFGLTDSLKVSTIEKHMDTEKYHIKPEDIGCHKAKEKEYGGPDNIGLVNYAYLMPTGYGATYALPGYYIYDNASIVSYGSPRKHKSMPFENTSDGDNPLVLAQVNVDFTCRVYTVTYWVKSNNTYTDNCPGDLTTQLVNNWGPRSGRKYGPMTRSTPSTVGRWRCDGQELEHDRDDNGDYLIKITRKFVRVPSCLGDIRWNPDRYGGWWSEDWPMPVSSTAPPPIPSPPIID